MKDNVTHKSYTQTIIQVYITNLRELTFPEKNNKNKNENY